MSCLNSYAAVAFSGLSELVVEEVVDDGDVIRVVARSRDTAVACPVCGRPTERVHGYHRRTARDVPVDGRQVMISLRVRRLVCPHLDSARQTFREQVPGLLERLQRRHRATGWTAHRRGQGDMRPGRCPPRPPAGHANPPHHRPAPVAPSPCPTPAVPRVIGVDDFALHRRHRYATVIIDAETGRRIDVLPDREAATLTAWLRRHPGAEVVCRDGSATYAEAIRQALPTAVQVSDRWHPWKNLCDKVLDTVRAHAPAGAPSARPAPAASASRPPATDGTRSTHSLTRASGSWTRRRRRQPPPPLEQRPHRRHQHPHQANHAPEARPSRLRSPRPPHPAQRVATQRHHRLHGRPFLLMRWPG